MGGIADAVLAGGGVVTGVIPERLVAQEIAHRGLTDLRVVRSMHERKAMMSELADAFIALPGGLGTFDEFLEAATSSQLGVHAKPCGLFNVRGYFDPLIALIDGAVDNAFLSPEHRRIVVSNSDPLELLIRLDSWRPPAPKRPSF
jgi:uncharacterized protein (TIGR00730 family)